MALCSWWVSSFKYGPGDERVCADRRTGLYEAQTSAGGCADQGSSWRLYRALPAASSLHVDEPVELQSPLPGSRTARSAEHLSMHRADGAGAGRVEPDVSARREHRHALRD